MRRPTLSLVLPLHNEAEDLKDLETHLSSWLSAYEIECEIVLVDDGSTDDTRPRAEAWAARDPRVKVVPLLHPYGVEGALRAGLDRAAGEAIVLVDGELVDR
ncbi:MAG: glycosyltransferase, partial [Proteobacteria bacterium]